MAPQTDLWVRVVGSTSVCLADANNKKTEECSDVAIVVG